MKQTMQTVCGKVFIFAALFLFSAASLTLAQSEKVPEDKAPPPEITLPSGINETLSAETQRVTETFRQQSATLFEREPLAWDWQTIEYLPNWFFTQISGFYRELIEQSRIIGTAGSIVVLIFIFAAIYSIIFRNRVLNRVEKKFRPVMEAMPETFIPYFQSGLKLIVSALIPILLYGLHRAALFLTGYDAPWFLLAGRLLWLWLIAALVIGSLKEIFITGVFGNPGEYGRTMFRLGRIALIAVLLGTGIFWGAEAFHIRPDILALVHFSISVTLSLVIFLLLLKKSAILSLIPKRPYESYRAFVSLLSKFYYPLLFFSFIVALLWCIGYRELGRLVLFKLWGTALAIVLIAVIYHYFMGLLKQWDEKRSASDEAAGAMIRSLKSLLTYVTIVVTIVIGLNMLGLLDPLQRIMSFPVLTVAEKTITFWTIIQAVLILLAFVFASGIFQAYMDYKVYPALGVDAGLGYALNTFLKYLLLAVGLLTALRVIGLDLRLLFVFAGAIGIGIGIGLQNIAANIISGFSIIFGGRIRKEDWIEIGSTLGVVTDIHLSATKIRTRDNIEYLIPNANLISGTIVNYSLSSPLIRINLDVGVSYNADPKTVETILLAAAAEEPMVEKVRPPGVRFVGFGDNSIDFQLLFWINVKKTARRKVRSALYFSIFRRLAEKGIEIPFPQRDIHIKGAVPAPEAGNKLGSESPGGVSSL